MRVLSALALVFLGLTAPVRSQGTRHVELLAMVREALGGEARLSTIRSFTMKGNIVNGTGPTKDFGSFDIACELPDRFVHSESRTWLRAGDGASVNPSSFSGAGAHTRSAATRIGFSGPRVIYEPNVDRIREVVPAAPEEIPPLMDNARRRFAQFSVGLFAASMASAPLTFEDSDNDPWSIKVTGSGLTRTLTIDPDTHLPAQFGELHYSDYRSVNGWRVPHRFRSGIETWEVKTFDVNVAIPAKTFR